MRTWLFSKSSCNPFMMNMSSRTALRLTAIGRRIIRLRRPNKEEQVKSFPKNNTVLEIQRELRQLGNAEIARHSLRFFKTGPGQYGAGDRFLGIRVPALRVIAKKHQTISLDDAAELLKSGFHEERLTALFILVRRYQKPVEANEREAIYRLYLDSTRWINNWDLVDCSALYIVGPHLMERDKRLLYRLARSKNLWERRIAVLATFYFIQYRQFDDALRIAEILLTDPEDLIHKAVGWMLREIGKRDIETEERFLKRHCRQMPRTMLRYALEKFPEEKRQRYLKGTIGEA
jgi:3-methyladenine DNA glycosylase AlkD